MANGQVGSSLACQPLHPRKEDLASLVWGIWQNVERRTVLCKCVCAQSHAITPGLFSTHCRCLPWVLTILHGSVNANPTMEVPTGHTQTCKCLSNTATPPHKFVTNVKLLDLQRGPHSGAALVVCVPGYHPIYFPISQGTTDCQYQPHSTRKEKWKLAMNK